MRKQLKKFAAGGDAAQTARYARKTADIESDYQKALKAGRSSGIAKAKYEQRMADAADDLAKWTRSDRTQTRAAESAAEKALSEARRTKGVSALRSQTPAVFKSMMDEGPIGVTPGAEVGRVASPSTTRATPRPRAAAPTPRRDAPAPKAAENKNEEIVVTGRRSTPAPGSNLQEIMRKGAALRSSFTGPPLGGMPSSPRGPRRLTVDEVVTPGGTLTAEQRRRLEEAVARSGTRSSGLKKGGAIKKKPVMKYAKGGSIDGCAIRGKTRVGRK